jgi:hypothetical protein
MRTVPRRRYVRRFLGFSELQVISAVIVLTVAASSSMYLLRPDRGSAAREEVAQSVCDHQRQKLQVLADRHFAQSHRWPNRDMSDLMWEPTGTGIADAPAGLVCPCGVGRYQMSGALVMCPVHEATRKD